MPANFVCNILVEMEFLKNLAAPKVKKMKLYVDKYDAKVNLFFYLYNVGHLLIIESFGSSKTSTNYVVRLGDNASFLFM